MVNIYVAGYALIYEWIKNLTVKEKDFNIIGEVSNPSVIIEQVKNLKLNLLLFDLSMPDKIGLDVLKEVKLISPHIKVLIMTIIPKEQFSKRTCFLIFDNL